MRAWGDTGEAPPRSAQPAGMRAWGDTGEAPPRSADTRESDATAANFSKQLVALEKRLEEEGGLRTFDQRAGSDSEGGHARKTFRKFAQPKSPPRRPVRGKSARPHRTLQLRWERPQTAQGLTAPKSPEQHPKFDPKYEGYEHEKRLVHEVKGLEHQLSQSKKLLTTLIEKLLLAPEDEAAAGTKHQKRNAQNGAKRAAARRASQALDPVGGDKLQAAVAFFAAGAKHR